MPLDIDQHRTAAQAPARPPVSHRHRQSGQQHVVDPAVEHRRHRRQHRPVTGAPRTRDTRPTPRSCPAPASSGRDASGTSPPSRIAVQAGSCAVDGGVAGPAGQQRRPAAERGRQPAPAPAPARPPPRPRPRPGPGSAPATTPRPPPGDAPPPPACPPPARHPATPPAPSPRPPDPAAPPPPPPAPPRPPHPRPLTRRTQSRADTLPGDAGLQLPPARPAATRSSAARHDGRPPPAPRPPAAPGPGPAARVTTIDWQNSRASGPRPASQHITGVSATGPPASASAAGLAAQARRGRRRGRQRGRGLQLEHLPRADHQPCPPRRRHQQHRQDAVPAQVEEPVLGSHPPPRPAPRRTASTTSSSAADPGPRPPPPANSGAGSAARSSFPFGGHRQRVQHDDGCGHHVVGQPRGRRARAPAPGPPTWPGGGDHVAGQRWCPGWSSRAMTAAWRHAGERGQHRLDLAGLDPEPADLHLVIGPARRTPARRPPSTGPGRRSGTSARPGAERAGHKPLRGQPRPAQVAARQPGPGHVQLPGHPRPAPAAAPRPARRPGCWRPAAPIGDHRARRPAGRSSSRTPWSRSARRR